MINSKVKWRAKQYFDRHHFQQATEFEFMLDEKSRKVKDQVKRFLEETKEAWTIIAAIDIDIGNTSALRRKNP